MAGSNPLNVYKGPDSIRTYFDPDSSPPLPLVEIPDCLNPFRQDGVRIYAKMMTMHPANNVKSMPALNLLENSVIPGKTKAVVEYSSGSTVLSMSMIARALHGLPSIQAFLSNKTSLAKLRLMQFFGIEITLFGGPSQPEPTDHRGGIRAAQSLAEGSDTVINPNQYENDHNWKAHVKWTGPQIFRQLPEINVICAGMGTSGTMTGLGTYFKDAKPSVFRLGVCTAAGDRVPGPRSYALLAPVEFPWKSSVDQIEEVGSHDSFSWSIELCRQGLVCGPSSGLNLRGLLQFIKKRKAAGTLSDLAGPSGEIHCVFLCCDLPYQYINDYFEKLGEGYFPSMQNEQLLDVDLYRYDEKWERDPSDVLPEFFHYTSKTDSVSHVRGLETAIISKPDTAVIDMRQPADYEDFSLPGSLNVPFVHRNARSPFSDPSILRSLWKELEKTFVAPSQEVKALLNNKHILIACYDGDSSRVATSVLRAKGYQADSVRGGFKALNGMKRDSGCLVSDEQDGGYLASWMEAATQGILGVATQYT